MYIKLADGSVQDDIVLTTTVYTRSYVLWQLTKHKIVSLELVVLPVALGNDTL